MLPARLDAVLFATDDMPAHRAFYEGLGWRTGAPDGAAFVPFDLDGITLALWTREIAEEVAGPCRDAGIEFHDVGLLTVVAHQDEVDAATQSVERAGARILSPPQERPAGLYSVWFADPDGTPWEVASNVSPRPRARPRDPVAGGLVPRLDIVSRTTADVLGLRDFYEGLGWRTASERGREDIVQFQVPTGVFSPWTHEEARPEVAAPLAERGLPFREITLGVVVESADRVDAELEHARGAGATVLVEPFDQSWGGRSAYFIDPVGMPWEIVWIRAARLDERNRLRLEG